MSLLSDPPVPSSVGRYRLMDRIAVGGMAEVYRASLAQTAGAARIVVVKRMLPRISMTMYSSSMP